MASSVATPLERQFGRIAGVTEMTSSSSLGSTSITLQFDLNRNIDAAARDVQAAINAARGQLPANLPSNPTYRKVNPADAPIMILALTSDIYDRGRRCMTSASSILAAETVAGRRRRAGQRRRQRAARRARRGQSDGAEQLRPRPGRRAHGVDERQRQPPEGTARRSRPTPGTFDTTDQLFKAERVRPLIVAYRNGAPVRLPDVADVIDSVEDIRNAGLVQRQTCRSGHHLPPARRQHHRDGGSRARGAAAASQPSIPAGDRTCRSCIDRTTTIRASVHDVEIDTADLDLLVDPGGLCLLCATCARR